MSAWQQQQLGNTPMPPVWPIQHQYHHHQQQQQQQQQQPHNHPMFMTYSPVISVHCSNPANNTTSESNALPHTTGNQAKSVWTSPTAAASASSSPMAPRATTARTRQTNNNNNNGDRRPARTRPSKRRTNTSTRAAATAARPTHTRRQRLNSRAEAHQRAEASGAPPPSGCQFCGGLHWNRQCPRRRRGGSVNIGRGGGVTGHQQPARTGSLGSSASSVLQSQVESMFSQDGSQRSGTSDNHSNVGPGSLSGNNHHPDNHHPNDHPNNHDDDDLHPDHRSHSAISANDAPLDEILASFSGFCCASGVHPTLKEVHGMWLKLMRQSVAGTLDRRLRDEWNRRVRFACFARRDEADGVFWAPLLL